jgi:hypothetical protein
VGWDLHASTKIGTSIPFSPLLFQQSNSNLTVIIFFLGQSAKLNKALDLCPPPTPSAEAPRGWGGLIRHHHAAGVANGTTMVVVFVGWLTLVR